MCGRFTNSAKKEEIEKEFGVGLGHPVEARYNIAPLDMVGAIRVINDQKVYAELKWGLIPAWSKDDTFARKLKNARAETLADKPSFRDAYKKRRCIIPATGFYEWKKTPNGKEPYYIYLKDKDLFGFGGLWEQWVDRETGELVETCTIITTEANSVIESIHERMPVIIEPDEYDDWLNINETDHENLKFFTMPFETAEMDYHRVDKKVRNPKIDSEDLIKPL